MKTSFVCRVLVMCGIGMLAWVPAAALPFALTNTTSASCGGTGCVGISPSSTLVQQSVPIGSGHLVTNSFDLYGTSRIFRGAIVFWGEMPARIDWWITTEPFGGTILDSGSQAYSSGYEPAPGLFTLAFDMNAILKSGTYWLQVADGIGLGSWDQCDGSSRAFVFDGVGVEEVGSETFSILGADVLAPEPPMLVPFGLGMLVLLGWAAHRIPE